MKFKALPVKVGDSFYLQTSEYNILVDGGMDKKDIVKLLIKEKIPNNHFDVMICTHYDADHINGILGILKSNKFTFNELWLPEIIGSIGYTVSKNVIPILEELHRTTVESLQDVDGNSVNRKNENFGDGDFENSYEKIDFQQLKTIKKIFDNNLFLGFYFPIDYPLPLFNALQGIINCLLLSYSSGSHIRWFKYQNNLLDTLIRFNLYAQNCKQSDITLYSEQDVMKLLYLSTINKECLVFKYEDEKVSLPNILFTGDSDLSFCQTNNIILRDGSIVTAPHHGSSSNDSSYGKITGNDLIYVRSDRSQVKRPGKGYLGQKNRYCTVCRNKTSKQGVELVFNSSSFSTTANSCIC